MPSDRAGGDLMVMCTTLGHEDIPATVMGFLDDPHDDGPDVPDGCCKGHPYCAACGESFDGVHDYTEPLNEPERADWGWVVDQARLEAVFRLLLDSGDMTPTAVRQIRAVARG